MNNYQLGQQVYTKIGMGIYPVEIGSITIVGDEKIYGLDMVLRKGASNEVRERIADAKQESFYILGVDGFKPCT